ncbi:MAG: SDR family oxidoreductase [Rhodospirillales bacterium]|jgi:NAD(P)-dependent dehydrogenase (short-subunit alcohol dehydrogenase family)|nr:SDR family oxidoreductase [Rhodospirillales bacterium]
MNRFDTQVAVVTGGASGIGVAVATRLAAEGARVVIADRDVVRAREVAARLGGLALTVDVADATAVAALAEQAEATVGPVDLLVTSAGVTQTPLPPEDLASDAWQRVMDIDLRGTWLTCVAFGNRMARRRRGAIVTIASITGLRSTPLHAYGPAKAAVISLTANLAAEWGRSGVRVNAVAPGYTLTPLLQAEIDAGKRDPDRLIRNAALGRLVQPEEVARAICFLLSEDASAVTGACLPVDAGWLTAGPWDTYGGLRPERPTNRSGD